MQKSTKEKYVPNVTDILILIYFYYESLCENIFRWKKEKNI